MPQERWWEGAPKNSDGSINFFDSQRLAEAKQLITVQKVDFLRKNTSLIFFCIESIGKGWMAHKTRSQGQKLEEKMVTITSLFLSL
jgi:hypothetical protein